MSDGGNGHRNRLHDLDSARSSPRRGKPISLTPDEARALIDSVLREYGLDPLECTDPFGWRHLSLGSVEGAAGVIEWKSGEPYLVVFAPILELPDDPSHLSELYRLLLELNHDGTLSARLSIHDDTVHVGLTRPIRGLDKEEVDDAIHTVMSVADHYDEWLQSVSDQILGAIPPAPLKLPNIKITPQEAQVIGSILAVCDPHGQDMMCYLMERWQKTGYIVEPGTTGIGLKAQVGTKTYSLAGMRPGIIGRAALIILSWEGLRKQKVFPAKAIDKFQAAVLKIVDPKITESTVHIEIAESFDLERAKALLQAMRVMAKAAEPELAETKFIVDPNLPEMQIDVGSQTRAGIQETLQACEPRVQQMYATLIEGWNQAGGTAQCSRPGRIYLKFKSREHEFGEYGKQSHLFNLIVLAAPKGKRGPAIEVTWNLATRDYAYLDYIPERVAHFEAAVSRLPGFTQEGTVTRLVIDESFQPTHTKALLEAMLELKAAGWGT